MSRLLSAGFTRLFKNKLFHTAIIVMFALGCFAGHTKWSDFSAGFTVDLTDALFTYCLFGACVILRRYHTQQAHRRMQPH